MSKESCAVVEALIKKAGESQYMSAAMKLTQAALNAANALRTLSEIPNSQKK